VVRIAASYLLPASRAVCGAFLWYSGRLMTDETEPTDETPADTEAPAPLAEPITDRFLFVDVAALRAKQLRRGALPRLRGAEGPLPAKAERIAMEEVRRGLVQYDTPPAKAPASAART
jgi:DNA-directed RNA polymerase subunit K/omega